MSRDNKKIQFPKVDAAELIKEAEDENAISSEEDSSEQPKKDKDRVGFRDRKVNSSSF